MIIFMQDKYQWVLIFKQMCRFFFFILMVSGREGSVFHKSYQQLFPPIYHELGITEFHLSKNSSGVKITWTKVDFKASTYEYPRAWQSWGGNHWTPCRKNISYKDGTCKIYRRQQAGSLHSLRSPFGSQQNINELANYRHGWAFLECGSFPPCPY